MSTCECCGSWVPEKLLDPTIEDYLSDLSSLIAWGPESDEGLTEFWDAYSVSTGPHGESGGSVNFRMADSDWRVTLERLDKEHNGN